MARRVGRTVIVAATIGAALLVGNLPLVDPFNTKQLRDESATVAHSSDLLLALDNVSRWSRTPRPASAATSSPAGPSTSSRLPQRRRDLNADGCARRPRRGDPVQLRLIADMRRHVGAKLGELDLTIGLRDRKGFDLARDVSARRRQAEMEALHATAAEMASHEAHQLRSARPAATRPIGTIAFQRVRRGRWSRSSRPVRTSLMSCAVTSRRATARSAVIAAQGETPAHTLASIGDAVITTDLAGGIYDLNAVAEALTGWRGDEAQRAAARGGLSHRRRIRRAAGREPRAPGASRRRRRRPRQPYAPDPQDGSERRSTTARRRSATRDGRSTAASSSFATSAEEGRRARARRGAVAPERVVTDMAIPTMVFAEDGEVVLVNRAWTRISGFAAAELATIPAWTKHAYGERAEAMNEVIAVAVRSRRGGRQRRARDHDGERREADLALRDRPARPRRPGPAHARHQRDRRHRAAPPRPGAGREGSAHAAGDGRGELRRLGVGPAAAARWSGPTRRASCSASAPTSRSASSASSSASIPTTGDRRARAIAEAWVTGVHGNEYRIVRPDGEVRWVSSRGRVIRGPGGSERMLGVVGDITEQKRAVEALEGGRPPEGRIPRHARPRAAQPARAAAQLARDPAADGRRPGDVRQGERRDGAPAQPPRAPDRRPARRQPRSAATSSMLRREVVDLARGASSTRSRRAGRRPSAPATRSSRPAGAPVRLRRRPRRGCRRCSAT